MLRTVGWLLTLLLLVGGMACNRTLIPAQVVPERIEIDAALDNVRSGSASAERIRQMIAPYQAELGQSMDEVIGRVPRELTMGRPESTLGNWLADLLYIEAVRYGDRPVDFALQNAGGIRINRLPVGDLVVRNVYELMPFDNELVLMELDYATTLALIDHLAAQGGWPVSRQLRFRITSEGQAADIKLNGKPLRPERRYVVALPDYVAGGGSDSDFLAGKPQIETGKFIRDLILLHAREAYEQGRTVSAELDGRIRE